MNKNYGYEKYRKILEKCYMEDVEDSIVEVFEELEFDRLVEVKYTYNVERTRAKREVLNDSWVITNYI